MRLITERRHVFAVPPARLWEAMVQIDRYRSWWPWLRSFDGSAVATGSTWACAVRPRLGYPVRFEVELASVDAPNSIESTVRGDVSGTARVSIAAHRSGSELLMCSDLVPTGRLLRTIARFAPPVARWSHGWLLDRGLRQFEQRALGGPPAHPPPRPLCRPTHRT